MPPVLYIKSVTKLAEDGLGDGTVYASATTAAIDQAAKTFTFSGLATLTDLGDVADDGFNGCVLYFLSSGNKYHIVDWDDGNVMATVYETPAIIDIGACEIRKTVYENDSLNTNPPHFLSDGVLSTLWKSKSANQAISLEVYLPNLIEDGGFEKLSAGAIPAYPQNEGIWCGDTAFAVSDTTPLLGSRMMLFTYPGSGDKNLYQRLARPVKRGRTYRIRFKTQAITGNTLTGALAVKLVSSGTSNVLLNFNPGIITTTAAWHTSNGFTATVDSDDVLLDITAVFAGKGSSATEIRVDEFYLWEEVNVEAIVFSNHNLDGITLVNSITGYSCSPSRTSVGTADREVLLASDIITGNSPYAKEFTAGIYPVYQITIAADLTHQYQIGQLFLCEKWAWERGLVLPFDPAKEEVMEKVQTSINGTRRIYRYNQLRRITGTLPSAPAIDLAIWNSDYKQNHFDGKYIIPMKLSANYPLIMVQDIRSEWGNNYVNLSPDLEIDWQEVV